MPIPTPAATSNVTALPVTAIRALRPSIRGGEGGPVAGSGAVGATGNDVVGLSSWYGYMPSTIGNAPEDKLKRRHNAADLKSIFRSCREA
jgi:hypothetical protein